MNLPPVNAELLGAAAFWLCSNAAGIWTGWKLSSRQQKRKGRVGVERELLEEHGDPGNGEESTVRALLKAMYRGEHLQDLKADVHELRAAHRRLERDFDVHVREEEGRNARMDTILRRLADVLPQPPPGQPERRRLRKEPT